MQKPNAITLNEFKYVTRADNQADLNVQVVECIIIVQHGQTFCYETPRSK